MTTVSESIEERHPPCRIACPAGINVQAYIGLVAKGKFDDSLKIIRESIPFPSVCGRVCFSPCEDACTRKDIDESLSIRALKRLVADEEFRAEMRAKPSQILTTRDEKIAIIGSGPAGLTAAYELAKLGYPVTVFEGASQAGGCLRDSIPYYRLPEEILESEINYIQKTGVEILTDTEIGKDLTFEDIKSRGFRAIFLATGAHRNISLNIEGEKLDGVLYALDFLKNVHRKQPTELGNKIAIIGGGNVAVDAARTAKRLAKSHNDVTVFYRRTEKEMPAYRKEVEEAKQEGVKFHFLASPKKILGKDGKSVGLECLRNELGPPDKSGRRRPIPVDGSEFVVPVDSVLIAIGMRPEVSFLPPEIELAKGNRIVVNEVTFGTNLDGVFAGGDAVTGPASVIEAIAAGRKAAVSIDRYINGSDLEKNRTKDVPEMTWVSDIPSLPKKDRLEMPCLKPDERVSSFKEVELGLTPEVGVQEACRCLYCGPCSECLEPRDLCEADDAVVDEDRCIACANCEKICEYGAIRVAKSVAKVDPMLCKGCGTCVVECPAEAIAMHTYSDEMILTQISEAAATWSSKQEPQILVFICTWAFKEDVELELPHNSQLIPVRCTGRVDPLHILRAFMLGVDGVAIISCSSQNCHYVFGEVAGVKRVQRTKEWLDAVGVDPKRLQVKDSSVGHENHIVEMLTAFTTQLQSL